MRTRSVRDGLGEGHPVHLLVETAAVAILTLGAVKWLCIQHILDLQWLMIPAVLTLAATVPGWFCKRDFPRIGLDADAVGRTLIEAGWVSACVIPVMFAGLWSVRQIHASAGSGQALALPLAPVIRHPADWLGYLLYQFLYVAVAEEVFFRGYIQSNAMRLCSWMPWAQPIRSLIVILVSAGCFAVAHAVIQEQVVSLLTFFPGLMMAWLFLRTGSLLAPILFHGIANAAYGVAAAVLS